MHHAADRLRLLGTAARASQEVQKLLASAPEDTIIEVDDPFGLRIRAPVSEETVRSLLAGPDDLLPAYQPASVFLLLLATVRGGTFLDIGSQVGYFSMVVAQQTEEPALIYAWERNPTRRRWLMENLRRNGLSERVHVAVLRSDQESAIAPTAGSERTIQDQAEIQPLVLHRMGIPPLEQLLPPVVVSVAAKECSEAFFQANEPLFQSPKTSTVLFAAGTSDEGEIQRILDVLEEWGYQIFGVAPREEFNRRLGELFRPPLQERQALLQSGDPVECTRWLAQREGHPNRISSEEAFVLYPSFGSTLFFSEEQFGALILETNRRFQMVQEVLQRFETEVRSSLSENAESSSEDSA